MNRSSRPIGVIAALLMSLVLVPGLVLADENDDGEKQKKEGDWGRPGIYLGFNGMGALNVDRRGSDNDLTGGGGFNARVGSREGPVLAWEFIVEWTILDGGVPNSIYDYGINAKFFFSEDILQPYIVLGAGGETRTYAGKPHRTDWGFRMGAGADFYLTEHWALNSEYSYVVGVGKLLKQEHGSFSLGVIYRF